MEMQNFHCDMPEDMLPSLIIPMDIKQYRLIKSGHLPCVNKITFVECFGMVQAVH
jgi:hypothetical protein